MKRIFNLIFLLFVIVSILVGCAKEPTTAKNKITPKELSQEQKDIVSLLSSDKQEILLFDYITEDVY